MVNVKALIVGPVTLMTTAVMAQSSINASQVAELEASASIALADMASVAQKMSKLEDFKQADFDSIQDFVSSVLYPLGFGELCDTLTNVSSNLGYILDLNTKNGVHCTDEQRNTINAATSCKANDDISGFVNAVVWPLAIRGFKDTAEKINAQAACLRKLLTGQ
ncbi:hypothetical protein [Parasitella parasitica]|uniref:Uncharacterized protein n=1 Tax=Parasitella parasitica TaxID=35722 RepID=A0A0B7N9A2_9FUNG|nr:hypothetical protein [Parasitella parasitica]